MKEATIHGSSCERPAGSFASGRCILGSSISLWLRYLFLSEGCLRGVIGLEGLIWKKETKMKVWQGVSLMLLGISIGFAGSRFFTVAPVHAHGQYTESELCATSVPKSWGEFKGASEYGIAFEDQNGTIRFLRSPSCSNGLTSTGNPLPPVDLRMERK